MVLAGLSVTIVGCDPDGGSGKGSEDLDVHGFANGCFVVKADDQYLARKGDDGYAFSADAASGAEAFTMRPSDLGTYLFYDKDGGYFMSEDGPLVRQTDLTSDIELADDTFISGAEWELSTSERDRKSYQLRHRKTGDYLTMDGLTADTADTARITFEEADGCKAYPELSVDAKGTIERTTFEDGDLYGIVDTHSHIMSNYAFGGGGIFHGAAFHRLGVEHALQDCSVFHGEAGKKDFFGYAFDSSGADAANLGDILPRILIGELAEDNHETAGYPDFTGWPDAVNRSTHQTQYYRWLERAHMAGLRLVVQHATTNSVICHMIAGTGVQHTRYSCDDMVAVDRILEATYEMERYIDAQAGGPGEGFFRIVTTPAQAREVIAEGKMAVILGIETSDLFNCRSVPRQGDPVCNEAYVREQLDKYYEQGVRVLFPVHKYDNAFSAGDGDRAFIELGNFLNSGHWSNFVEDCPDVPAVFDKGNIEFGDLNMPRDEFISDPPNDVSSFPEAPISVAFNYLSYLEGPVLEGDFCQNHGLTPLGETLLDEMMMRGMVIEIDHFSRRSYARAMEILEDKDYPAAGTHGTNINGELYALGGVSKTGIRTCRTPGEQGSQLQRVTDRVAQIEQNGGYPAEGFGFDLNGFAGAPGPRFGPNSGCADPQQDPVTYPFESFDGGVTFTKPKVGNRTIDFNEEGFVHIGMLPELLQDARNDAASDADLEPLFRSAEGYIRMWEKSEARGEALSGG